MNENNESINNEDVQAMLVCLSFKFGKQSGQDKTLTKETLEEQQAKTGGLAVTKRMICKEAFKQLCEIRTSFRQAIERVTIPWDIEGMRFCKPKAVTKVVQARDMFGPMFDATKTNELLGRYDHWLKLTREQVGLAFNEAEFPSKKELDANVSWSLSISALPKAEALRKVKDLDETLMAQLAKAEDARIKASIKSGMSVAWGRMIDPLQKMVSVLSGEKPRIFESLVGHVNEAVASIESINLTDDPTLYEFANRTKGLLEQISVEDLRDDKLLRASVVKKSNAILETFGAVGKRLISE